MNSTRQPAPGGWQSLWGAVPGRASAELEEGQHVIVVARWILIAAGLVLTVMPPATSLDRLRVQLPVILFLAVANFFLHAHLLQRRPTPDGIVYAASAADLAVVTTLVVLQGGFTTGLYIFYFPALAGLALAFPGRFSALYTVVAVGTYALACSGNAERPEDLVTRVAMLSAVAACAAAYRRLEGGRRAAAARLEAELSGRSLEALSSAEPAS